MRRCHVSWIAILVFVLISCTGKIAPEEEAAAIHAAEKWLSLVDSEAYEASWRASADFFKEVVTQDEWLETMTEVRKPLGPLVSRKVKATEFRTMMPRALKGKYLIIEYQSSFASRKSVVESLTAMMEKDGRWQVGGYHLD